MRRWIPAAAWDNPVTVLMGCLALLVLGTIAYINIPVQLMPQGFEPSFLWVNVRMQDGSPKEIDELVVRPVEGQLATIAGLASLSSEADDDNAGFGLEFHQSVDMDRAYNDVVDRLERAMADLPSDVESYYIWRYNPDDEPIVWIGVSTPESVTDPYFVLNRIIQPKLERIPGVAATEVWGVPQRRIGVEFDRERMITHKLSTFEVQQALFRDSFQMSGGRIHDRGTDRLVRSVSRMTDIEQLKRFPVADGLFLEDVASVEYQLVGSRSINRVDGAPGAVIPIRKESSANTVETTQAVMAALEELKNDPRVEGSEFHVFFSQGELIEQSMVTLRDTALIGGLFAVIILFVFLRDWRMTLLISLAIPFSLLITVSVLYLRGDSLNLLALMGLMLAVGMVVDNGIVVVETIYRERAAGKSPREAAISGTSEVNLAILMSTLTTMVVFLPVILMSEDAGFSFFMGVLGFPVVFALAASLLVAVVFAPLATRYIGAAEVKADPRWLVWVTERYSRLLAWVLSHRTDAAMALIAMFLLTLFPLSQTQCAGEADGNINDFTIRFSTPREAGSSTLVNTTQLLEDLVENHKEQWGVRVYRSRTSIDNSNGRIYVYLDSDTPIPREQVIEQAKSLFPTDLPGTEIAVGWGGGGAGGTNTASVTLTGEDVEVLEGLADEARRRLAAMPGVLDAHLDREGAAMDEIQLAVKREQAERYGVTATEIGQTVSAAMRLNRLPSLLEGDREIDVVSSFEDDDRRDIATLRDFPTFSQTTGGLVPLRTLTEVVVTQGPVEISRENRQTALKVTADLETGDNIDGFALVDAALADMAFPRGYGYERGRDWDQQEADQSAMYWALFLSITFVFLLMGVLFESVLLPLAVITTVPLAIIGAFWGLYLTGTPMDVMAGIGLVILVGVIVNNGIVLVDLVTQMRASGMTRTDALLRAAERRFRPIVMTALTTICGLIPMAAGSSSFVGIPYSPMGRIVVSGLIVGTLLTLVFVPWIYSVLDDLGIAGRRLVSHLRRA